MTTDRTSEIKRELSELNQSLKMSVQKAIKIGQLLTEQKEFIGHGNFLSWLEDNIDIQERTAQKYMMIYRHKNKTALNADLQEAYNQIETIERQEKMSAEEKKRSLIAEFRKTGNKPEGWDRSLDYIIQKDKDEKIRAEARAKETIAQMEKESKEKSERQQRDTLFDNALNDAINNSVAKSSERQQWQDKIRISDSGKEDAFNQAIMDYMETLPDDNRRIEACNNIIKICKNISIELQRKK
jgi:hypothetical protein